MSGGFSGQIDRLRPALRPPAQDHPRLLAARRERLRLQRGDEADAPDDATASCRGTTRTTPSSRRPTACRTGAGSSSTRNNTPRIARIDLTRFETDEILEIPNSAGGHASPFTTPDTQVHRLGDALQRADPEQRDVPIDSYKENFKGTLSFITADEPGKMDIAFQILMPGYNYDLGHAGKGPSDGWFFFTVVQHRAGVHEARAERVAERQGLHRRGELQARRGSASREGKAKTVPARVRAQLRRREVAHREVSETKTSVKMLDPKDCPGSSTTCRRRSRRTASTSIRRASTSSPAASSPR